jgi:hypothetical protein
VSVQLVLCEEVPVGALELEAEVLPKGTMLEAGTLEAGELEGPAGMLEAVDN